MSEKLGEALLDLDTNDKGLKAGIDRAERASQGLGRVFDDTSRRAIALGRNMAMGAAVGAAALGLLIKRSIDQADAMSKSAARAGMTTEELSRLAWAGELADVSLDAMTMSMGRLSNLMAQMARGDAKETKAIFDALGISVTDAEGKLRSTAEVFPELADRFAGMENGATKTALAMQIFGRSGAELIPLLNSGSAGLREMADESDRLGKTISTQAGLQAEEFNDTLTRLGAVVDGVGLQVGTALLPKLNELAKAMASPEFRAAAAMMGNAIVDALQFAVDAIAVVMARIGDVQNAVAWMNSHDMFGNPIEQKPGGKGFIPFNSREDAFKLLTEALNSGQTGGPDPSFYAGMFPQAPETTTLPRMDGGGGDFDFGSLGSGASAATDKVRDLVASLKDELAVLQSTDPVQQRMLSMRETLASATDAQKAEVESLIQTIYDETQAWEAAQAAGQFFGDQLLSSIEALRTGSKSLVDVLGDVVNALAQAVLQSMLMGQGPLSGLFGTQGANGGIGGLLGGLFSGFFAKGGLIPDGGFGIVGEKGPELVWGASGGTQVMSNPDLMGMMAGGGRGELHLTFNASGLTEAETRQIAMDAIDRFDRHQLPQRVADINADPIARG